MSKIREISADVIRDAVEALCIEANTTLPADVKAALDEAEASEPSPLAKQTLGLLQQNLCVAAEQELPICQDTGMACVFVELGQDVHIEGDLNAAVDEGVRRGYEKAYLRKSITADPLQRVNTGTTPRPSSRYIWYGDRLQNYRGAQGRRQREHEPSGHAQACGRCAGGQRLCTGNGAAGGGQSLPAHCTRHRYWRQF